VLDAKRLKESWAAVTEFGDEVPLYFYSTLFLSHPETRKLFPVSMAAQRDRLVNALGRTVASVDDLDALMPFLQQLGADHRKFEVLAEHYPHVGGALLATLEHFLGPRWTPELAAAWTQAFGIVSKVMSDAARESERSAPPWWDAEVIGRDQRTWDITVLTLKPERIYPYQPGQSIAVESALRPKLWRYYSPANAPRVDNTIELHVRQVPGGVLSTALVQMVQVGDVLRLGSPVGSSLTLPPDDPRDLLLVAGGTGLAPLRALAEQAANEGRNRRVALFAGVRTRREAYDLKALNELQQRYPQFAPTVLLSDDPQHRSDRWTAVEAATRQGPWHGYLVYVCGSISMVRGTIEQLAAAGFDPESVRSEEFHSHPYPAAVVGAARAQEPA
jgi:ferredoxin-NADP reductase/hemoglobin-like flavoprotein